MSGNGRGGQIRTEVNHREDDGAEARRFTFSCCGFDFEEGECKSMREEISNGTRHNYFITGDNVSHSQTKKRVKSKKDASANLKTPVSLLYDICQKRGATITFPVEEQLKCPQQGRHMFKCVVQVTTAFGDIYEGTGFASCKRSAKHDAAKNLLLQMDPECGILLGPEFQQNTTTQSEHNRRRVDETALMPVASSEKVQEPPGMKSLLSGGNEIKINGEIASETAHSGKARTEGTVHVTTTQDDQITITLKLPYLNNTQGVRNFSLFDMIPVIREWRGEKISRLTRKSPSEVQEIKNPAKVVDVIATEQNLNVEYFVLEEKGDNGLALKYTCILEITSLPPEGKVEPPPCLHLTEFGTGADQEEAQRIAAKKFLLMIRMILNAN